MAVNVESMPTPVMSQNRLGEIDDPESSENEIVVTDVRSELMRAMKTIVATVFAMKDDPS